MCIRDSIQTALEEKEIYIDRSALMLDESIKALGIYHIPINLADELTAEIKIYVIKI